jgi:mono/diheme cytochrome c family protein
MQTKANLLVANAPEYFGERSELMARTLRFHFRGLVAAIAVLGFVFGGIQFIRPALTNPPVTADLDAPPPVKQIFKTACYNCHSNETRLAWFDQIVPAYWLVAGDVKKARSHLNFSDLGAGPKVQQKEMLFELINQIQSGDMPPRNYELLHGESKIAPEQLATLKKYLDPYRQHSAADAAQVAAANAEYEKWTQSGDVRSEVHPAPNGIAFIPEYKDWKMVSTTERFDNQTIRLVLGNEIAMKAIAANLINPWPDGTIFAKVAWDRLTDASGAVHTGQFKQVEFMIKDSKKYASTIGWGFARWKGAGLQPFGNDANFAQGCVGCHNPMRNNDFVFTMPIKGGK